MAREAQQAVSSICPHPAVAGQPEIKRLSG
jgi:hypothetical protein